MPAAVRCIAIVPALLQHSQRVEDHPILAAPQRNGAQYCPDDCVPVLLQHLPDSIHKEGKHQRQQLSPGGAHKLQTQIFSGSAGNCNTRVHKDDDECCILASDGSELQKM